MSATNTSDPSPSAHRLINCLFKMPNHTPVECEIQIHYRPILELKENEGHLFYGALL